MKKYKRHSSERWREGDRKENEEKGKIKTKIYQAENIEGKRV